jgi:hypothetical protein
MTSNLSFFASGVHEGIPQEDSPRSRISALRPKKVISGALRMIYCQKVFPPTDVSGA